MAVYVPTVHILLYPLVSVVYLFGINMPFVYEIHRGGEQNRLLVAIMGL